MSRPAVRDAYGVTPPRNAPHAHVVTGRAFARASQRLLAAAGASKQNRRCANNRHAKRVIPHAVRCRHAVRAKDVLPSPNDDVDAATRDARERPARELPRRAAAIAAPAAAAPPRCRRPRRRAAATAVAMQCAVKMRDRLPRPQR